MNRKYNPVLIMSGGQTGVDRAALDVAIELGMTHGGWCPKGRTAEDGCIPQHYQLKETNTENYTLRTRLNIKDSDATLIINTGILDGGTAVTVRLCKQIAKPYFIVQLDQIPQLDKVKDWLKRNSVSRLNIAGPRASKRKDIYKLSYQYLLSLFNVLYLNDTD